MRRNLLLPGILFAAACTGGPNVSQFAPADGVGVKEDGLSSGRTDLVTLRHPNRRSV